jgi:hypothetical protein
MAGQKVALIDVPNSTSPKKPAVHLSKPDMDVQITTTRTNQC